MNTTKKQLSWKERAMAFETQQNLEGDGGGARNSEMNVMWASSQGGCGPLKRLLKNVEDTVVSPPSQRKSPMFPELSSSVISGEVSPFQGLSQSSAPSSSSRSSASAIAGKASSSRHLRRTRFALSRINQASSKEVSSPSTHPTKPGSISNASQISHVLSRVSRSLNEKAMSEYSLSQRQRMQRSTHAANGLPSHRTRLQPKKALPKSPQHGTVDLSADPLHQSSSVLSNPESPNEIIGQSSSYTSHTSHRTAAITDSPRQVRIKALLETIDQAEPFPSTSSSSTAFVLHTRSKQTLSASTAIPKTDALHHTTPHHPPRKTLALGMRRPVVQSALPNLQAQPHTASTVFKLPSSQQASKLPLRGGDPESIGPTKVALEVESNLSHRETKILQNSGHGGRPQNPSRGYRISSAPPSSILTSLSLDEDIEMSEGLESHPPHVSVPTAGEAGAYDGELNLECGAAGEENEANMSDGASSGNSSYGDMGIDVAALEEACKVYDS